MVKLLDDDDGIFCIGLSDIGLSNIDDGIFCVGVSGVGVGIFGICFGVSDNGVGIFGICFGVSDISTGIFGVISFLNFSSLKRGHAAKLPHPPPKLTNGGLSPVC